MKSQSSFGFHCFLEAAAAADATTTPGINVTMGNAEVSHTRAKTESVTSTSVAVSVEHSPLTASTSISPTKAGGHMNEMEISAKRMMHGSESAAAIQRKTSATSPKAKVGTAWECVKWKWKGSLEQVVGWDGQRRTGCACGDDDPLVWLDSLHVESVAMNGSFWQIACNCWSNRTWAYPSTSALDRSYAPPPTKSDWWHIDNTSFLLLSTAERCYALSLAM